MLSFSWNYAMFRETFGGASHTVPASVKPDDQREFPRTSASNRSPECILNETF